MRKFLVGIALLASAEGAALACSCIMPPPPEEARVDAQQAVQGIVAIVEVEALTEFQPNGPGETVRVHRTLFGETPETFRIERRPMASSASCDLLMVAGQRKVLILKPGKGGAFQMQSLCSDYLTSEPYLPITIEEARRSAGKIDKAGERAADCRTCLSAG